MLRERRGKSGETASAAGAEVLEEKKGGEEPLTTAVGSFGWYLTCGIIVVISFPGFFFLFKEMFDPWFSDVVSPGPGQLLLGDAGRLLVFEAGADGLQSKLLGGPARVIEGIILGLGSIAIVSCWFSSPTAQFLTASMAPLEGMYYLIQVVYFPVVGEPALVIPMIVFGGGLVAVSLWRIEAFLRPDSDTKRKYYTYLAVLLLICSTISVSIYIRAQTAQEDIEMLIRVKEHFNANGMTWSVGNDFPDGFQK